MGRLNEHLKERNIDIVRMAKEGISLTAIGKLYDISTARVWQIVHNQNGKHNCDNCYHKIIYCACRELDDIIKSGNCPDWYSK